MKLSPRNCNGSSLINYVFYIKVMELVGFGKMSVTLLDLHE